MGRSVQISRTDCYVEGKRPSLEEADQMTYAAQALYLFRVFKVAAVESDLVKFVLTYSAFCLFPAKRHCGQTI